MKKTIGFHSIKKGLYGIFLLACIALTQCVTGIPVMVDEYPRFLDNLVVTLKIKSRPDNSAIFLNGEFIGHAPLIITRKLHSPMMEIVAKNRGCVEGVYFHNFLSPDDSDSTHVVSSLSGSQSLWKARFKFNLSFRLPAKKIKHHH